jgi:hypothetical protein
VVLHLPGVVEANAVGELDLLERVVQEAVLGALGVPGPRVLVLVEDAEPDSRILSSSAASRPMLNGWSPSGQIRLL